MPRIVTGLGLLTLILAAYVGLSTPASAEFFGCNDQHPHRTLAYSTRSYSVPDRLRYARGYTHDFVAQRSRSSMYSRQSYRHVSEQWR